MFVCVRTESVYGEVGCKDEESSDRIDGISRKIVEIFSDYKKFFMFGNSRILLYTYYISYCKTIYIICFFGKLDV